jgi:DNA-binding MarR family transcriptional regulator
MFRIEFSAKDKDVGEALKRLHGLALQVEYAYIPDNVEALRNGKTSGGFGSSAELIIAELHKRKLTEITGVQAKEIIKALGMNPVSYSHHLQKMVKHGFLRKGKRDGNAMTYLVQGK